MSITDAEADLALRLGDIWNDYLKLPVEHPMAQKEMCSAIHRCQDLILARPAARELVARGAPK